MMEDLKVIELIENIVNGFNKTLNERFDKVEHRLDKIEPQLETLHKKLDFTIEEVVALRADVTMIKKEEFEFRVKRVK